MDRLTERNKLGEALLSANLNEKYEPLELIDILLDRLAAYEDTGLSPEELDNLCRQMSKIRTSLGFKTLDDVYELVNEERLVLLPCKVGDTVYWIKGEAILEVLIQWFETNAYGWCACGTYPPLSTPTFQFADFGKMVFFTREEAEKALERSINNDEP